MIQFFRIIRQKLLTENKISKPAWPVGRYLIYAIGEIALVMIGILLALQVNNWNENRKNRTKNYQLLIKAHEELALNIERSNRVLRFYRIKEPIFSRVLNKEVTRRDYETSNIGGLIGTTSVVDVSDINAKNLTAFENQLNPNLDSLVVKINELYNSYAPRLKEWDALTIKRVSDYVEMLENTQEWFYLRRTKNWNNQSHDYYLNDPSYLNHVAAYELYGLRNHHRRNYLFNREAKSTYLDISSTLGLTIDTTLVGTPQMNAHYIGTYKYQDDILEIKEQGNRLVYMREGLEAYDFFPENDSTFVLGFYFGRLIKNEKQDITGMVLSLGTILESLEFVKIDGDD